jgi:hypothetical protein
MRYLNDLLYKVAYQRLLQVWSITIFYKERGKCKNQNPRRRTTSLTVWGICPVDECFKRPPSPRNAPPYSRGSFPDPKQRGGEAGLCQFLLQSSQKPPVKVARCQNCINRIVIDSSHNQNHAATGGGCNRAQAQSPSQYWAAVFVPVYFASCMHICMHDLITPIVSISTTTQLPLPLTLPTLSAWNQIRARSQNAFFTSNSQTAYSKCKKDLHHKYAAIQNQMITLPNIDSSL